jgi:hypothetical protein
MMIRKTSAGYKVLSEKTGKSLGGADKREQKQKRLRQMEFSKRRKAKRLRSV